MSDPPVRSLTPVVFRSLVAPITQSVTLGVAEPQRKQDTTSTGVKHNTHGNTDCQGFTMDSQSYWAILSCFLHVFLGSPRVSRAPVTFPKNR